MKPHPEPHWIRLPCCLALLLAGGAAAPGGSDANPGTRELPLASPATALRRGRELRRLHDSTVADGVRIVLRGGEYALTEPVLVRPEDGGTAASPTVIMAAPGERPELSGGVAVTGWQKLATDPRGLPAAARGHLWVADAPRFNGRALEFRQLWVGGRKAVRARTPGDGTMDRLVAWDRAAREAWIPATTAVPANLDGVELVVLQMWEIAVLRLKSHRVEGDRAAVSRRARRMVRGRRRGPCLLLAARGRGPGAGERGRAGAGDAGAGGRHG